MNKAKIDNNANRVPFAFFGTPYVARDTLAMLIGAGYIPSIVVTSPDSRRGRGQAILPSETRELAEEHSIPTLVPSALNENFIEELKAYGAHYAVIVAYGKILPQALIDAFPLGVLNIHYSLLPKYRGASPVESALLNGETETGVTIQRMVLKMDAGDILAQRVMHIEGGDTTTELRARLIQAGAELLIETLPTFISRTATATPQDETQTTFAKKIAKEDGHLSLKGDPETNWRKYRAYRESPGTFFYATNGNKRIRVKIAKASKTNDEFVVERVIPESKTEQDYSLLIKNKWLPE